MSAERDPFAILGIAPTADATAIEAAYRAKARQLHPDVAGGSTEAMREVNWARDELRADLAGWRSRVTDEAKARADSRRNTVVSDIRGNAVAKVLLEWVEVFPQVLIITGGIGVGAEFSARALAVPPELIKVRVPLASGLDVERLSPNGALARFRVRIQTLTPSGSDATVVALEVRAPDHSPNKVFVSIQPLNASVVSQTYPGERIAPARHVSPSAKVSFGKHKGRTYSDVALEDPGYLRWMVREGISTIVEQECAKAALGYAPPRVGADHQVAARPQPSRISSRQPVQPVRSAQPMAQLPDPNRARGVLGTIKALFKSGGK